MPPAARPATRSTAAVALPDEAVITTTEAAATAAHAPAVKPATAKTRKPVPSADQVRHAFESGEYPYDTMMSRRAYEAQKARLQSGRRNPTKRWSSTIAR